jgi:transketolase
MRRKFVELLYNEMTENQNIVVLVGDVGYGMFDNIMKHFPSRFFNIGASEQLMIGAGVGLALEQKIPVCYSITPFLLYRPFEFIRNYLSHEKIPVKLVGGGRNNDYGVCGFSHYAFEDKQILEVIGGIDIYHPQTPNDINIKQFLYKDTPSYINLTR